MINLSAIVDSLWPIFHTFWGMIFFIPIYSVWVTFLLPATLLSMVAGAIYGPFLGSFLVFIGAFLGAQMTFFIARIILRDWFKARINNFPKINAIQKRIAGEGLKLIILTRLSPAFPFSLLNFSYGLTDVKFIDYSIGLFGIVPGTILFCSLGAIAGDLANFNTVLDNTQDPFVYSIRIVGLAATIAVIYLFVKVIKVTFQDPDQSE